MNEQQNEVDWSAVERKEMARPKYGSYIRDLEESVAAKDWQQVEKDLAALRRHHTRVMAKGEEK